VIAVDGIPERLDVAKACGASQVLNFKEGDVVAAVKEVTEGRGVDVALEVGG
jgi:S-(hydroxymethyl)glutathione dehydrogenase/alcohol dehydrogenase